MKRTLNRSLIVFLVAFAFFAGIALFCVRLGMGCEDWVQKPYNGHTAGSSGLTRAGAVYDRDGNVLAQTVNGERVYSDDYSVRNALLHLVGDNSLNISTAVQSVYRTDLTGYNYIWGMGLPESLRFGNDMTLTVDSSACAAAYNLLGSNTGACVVYNYKTGEVLCSVSTKTYDPQSPPEITDDNEEEYDGVYLDHVMSSSFVPGSTFKIITAAAAIENLSDLDSFEVYCDGSEEIGGSEVTCTEAHGTVGINSAFASSCNVFFAKLATMVGAEKMQATAERMGINSNFKVSGVSTAKGNYDVLNANENELAWSGAGQYTDLANPMQMAILCGAIANGGTPVLPEFIKETGLFKLGGKKTGEALMSTSTASALQELMRGAVVDHYGEYLFGGLTACAKTGTAEVGDGERPNSWMVGFTTDEDLPLAFAVVVEHGGYGIDAAGSVVSAVLSDIAAGNS